MTGAHDGVLVVCAANVCRSPMAAFALRCRFAAVPELVGTAVRSAGVRVAETLPACPDVARFRPGREWQRLADVHRSRPLGGSELRSASLVLAASRDVRSAVVAIAPDQRARVFTLREAVWLGRGYVGDARLEGTAAVEAFQRHIDGMRGLRPPPAHRRGSLWGRGAEHPLDIRDAHGSRGASHREALRSAFDAALEIADLIAGPRPHRAVLA